MKPKITFSGRSMFINTAYKLFHVTPANPGVYWLHVHDVDTLRMLTFVMLVDDFGNLVDCVDTAWQRKHFRRELH
jgi:hypothetical protein